jgi:hypothetical protein
MRKYLKLTITIILIVSCSSTKNTASTLHTEYPYILKVADSYGIIDLKSGSYPVEKSYYLTYESITIVTPAGAGNRPKIIFNKNLDEKEKAEWKSFINGFPLDTLNSEYINPDYIGGLQRHFTFAIGPAKKEIILKSLYQKDLFELSKVINKMVPNHLDMVGEDFFNVRHITHDDFHQDLKSDDHSKRMTAIFELGDNYSRRQENLKALRDLWATIDETESDQRRYEKINVAVSLWKLGDKQHIDFVFEQLKSRKAGHRAQAAALLGGVNTQRSKDALLDIVLHDPDLAPSFLAADSLGRIGTIDIIPDLERAKARNLGNLKESINKAIWFIKKRNKDKQI